MSDDPRPMLTLDEAAARLHVSTKTLRRYMADGRLDVFRLGPKLLRVYADSVDKLLGQVPTVVAPQRRRPAHRGALRELQVDHFLPPNAIVLSPEENRKLNRRTT